jgi:hypothetical protein
MTDPVQAAIAAARAKNEAQQTASENSDSSVPSVSSAPPAPAAYTPNAKRMSVIEAAINDPSSGVTGWLKIKPNAFFIGDEVKIGEKFEAIAVLSEWHTTPANGAFSGSIKGQSPEYIHTYDGLTDFSGRPWLEVVQQFLTKYPEARPYQRFDINLTTMKDYGKYQSGTRLGHSTSQTATQKFKGLVNQILKDGVQPDQRIVIIMTHEVTKNRDGQTYPTFELNYRLPEGNE